MTLVMVGVNHRQADLELREKLSLQEKELPQALDYFMQDQEISECFLLSTCNRTELYAICKENERLLNRFRDFFHDVKNQPFVDNSLPKALYVREGEEAVRHLFNVTCGLDSMVLGETQILGQVKEAYQYCQEAGSTGTYLHSLCQKAIATGKKVHTLTTLGQHAVSYGYAAVEVARMVFNSLNDHTLMVIGTGEMAKLTLQNLFTLGAKEVIVASRHRERALSLAERFKGKVINYTRLEGGLAQSDVIICATQAPHYIITGEKLSQVHRNKNKEPLLIIDLAVPRNVDPAVAAMENVFLYNLDDLQFVISENLKIRELEAAKAGSIIDEQVWKFSRWYKRQRAIPIITEMRRKGEQIRKEKMEQFGIGSLSPREQQLVDNLTKSIVNTILKEPVTALKDLCLQEDYEPAEKYTRQLFGLDQ